MDNKRCSRCGKDKPRDEFANRSDGQGLQSWCRSCFVAYHRTHQQGKYATIKVPLTLRDALRSLAEANGLSQRAALQQLIYDALRQPCAVTGCIRRAHEAGGLCHRCRKQADVRADARHEQWR